MQPATFMVRGSSGAAVISLFLSVTLSWPGTSRFDPAQALTM